MTRISVDAFEALIRDQLPLVELFGIRTVSIGEGLATLRMHYDPSLLRPGGTVAGPALMALADVAMYAVVLGLIGPVELAVTTNLSINFLRKPPPQDVVADARILKLGKRLAVAEVLLRTDASDDLVAHVTGTYSIPPERD
ncbi:MAG: PaaI family thioesterase [Alphaproteobacteria bacterium]|nr:PaaI family thioesterase [Alphaproteobacteria bacterium]